MGVLSLNIFAAVIWILCLVRLDRYRDDKRGTVMFLRFYFVGFLSVVPTFFLEWIHPLSRFSVDSHVLGSALEEFLVTGPLEEGRRLLEENYRRLKPSGRAALRRNLLKVLEPAGPQVARCQAGGSEDTPGNTRGYLRHLLRHPAELLWVPRPLPRRAQVEHLKTRKWYLAAESRTTGKPAAAR